MTGPWREWSGGQTPPTHPQAKVRAHFRGVDKPFTSRHEYPACRLRWTRKGEPGDIIAYKITKAMEEA